MTSMDPRDVLVEVILSSTLESLQKIAHDMIGGQLPHDFLATLSDTDRSFHTFFSSEHPLQCSMAVTL
ncbi:hypothetical protein PAXRUDRAFT_21147 [Paxillus rubicundulus Ve08.2h10]|uniref:Unplaced genomic scaffold scaffold_5206, whole genome shotgun sequence n=1 Tax=Paxillus rubicundulus Ve08.2h10 TaxID=930991 RepID=A0A0D0D7Z1_9AGAM|nr:hypothetical protein PAXRUDRAFT_21147 [Paxillus rubicundulus Ve08.2h10]